MIARRGLAAAAAAAGLSLAAVAPASADVLVDQTTGTPTAPAKAAVLADDFTVPAGPPYVLERVQLAGSGSGGVGIYVYSDAGGVPAGSPGAGTETGLVTGTLGGDKPPRANGDQLRAVPVPAGRYWLVAAGTGASSADAVWAWNGSSPQQGAPAVYSQGSSACPAPPPGGDFFAYRPLSSCGSQGPDLQFRVEGRPFAPYIGIPKRLPRIPNGGVAFRVTTPHPGEIRFRGPGLKTKHSVQSLNGPKNGVYSEALVMTPTGPVKKALTEGERRRITVKLTYTPFAGDFTNSNPLGVPIAPVVRKIKVLLKRRPLNGN